MYLNDQRLMTLFGTLDRFGSFGFQGIKKKIYKSKSCRKTSNIQIH